MKTIKIEGDGWMVNVSSIADVVRLILKKRDSAEVRALIPDEMITEAESLIASENNDHSSKIELYKKIGLICKNDVWRIPTGYIAMHEDGPAEEYAPSFYRRADGIHVIRNRSGRLAVMATMADYEGYGQEREIIGVVPKPEKNETSINRWSDGKTLGEIEEILQADEENE